MLVTGNISVKEGRGGDRPLAGPGLTAARQGGGVEAEHGVGLLVGHGGGVRV